VLLIPLTGAGPEKFPIYFEVVIIVFGGEE
jgi:hypothetical protein